MQVAYSAICHFKTSHNTPCFTLLSAPPPLPTTKKLLDSFSCSWVLQKSQESENIAYAQVWGSTSKVYLREICESGEFMNQNILSKRTF